MTTGFSLAVFGTLPRRGFDPEGQGMRHRPEWILAPLIQAYEGRVPGLKKLLSAEVRPKRYRPVEEPREAPAAQAQATATSQSRALTCQLERNRAFAGASRCNTSELTISYTAL